MSNGKLLKDEFWKDEKLVGGFNEMPPNMKEITVKEWVQSKFFSYTPENPSDTLRQVYKDGKYIYNFLSEAAEWTERFLDCLDSKELEATVRRNSRTGYY
jgi:hypothetical protein